MARSSAGGSTKTTIMILAVAAMPALSFAQTTGTNRGEAADATVNAENRQLDRKMKSICRGC
ncbi:MAG: hypothetical protein QHD01_15645 [Bradyrhizobium sp.]|uniref:hypothetical protein n=1 Tax=Bradyrhizobium sp. TaxID=376 RepID=UPI0029A67A3E|nr:hypothetical protein [Bradyrhizobium sp.]MDX3968021.1 hypothetical protein [Bradyrhizobium sp.]